MDIYIRRSVIYKVTFQKSHSNKMKNELNVSGHKGKYSLNGKWETMRLMILYTVN